jgi:hypothetical protein
MVASFVDILALQGEIDQNSIDALSIVGGRRESSASGDLSTSSQHFHPYSHFAPHGFPFTMQLAQMQGTIKGESCGYDLLVSLNVYIHPGMTLTGPVISSALDAQMA